MSIGACFEAICACFVSVAQTVNIGIYWIVLKVCRNAVRPISPDILYNIPTTHRIHSPCHISLAVQQFLSWNKQQLYRTACECCLLQNHKNWLLSVTETQELTAVCHRDSRTDCCLLQRHKNWLLSVIESQELTAVCYRDSRTDSIRRFSPMGGIQQSTTAGPTAITNWSTCRSS